MAKLCEIVPTVLAERGGGCGYELAGVPNQQIVVYAYRDMESADPTAMWGQLVSDTPQQDGSHLRVYRIDGQRELAYSQDQLTAIATDPRLVTFT